MKTRTSARGFSLVELLVAAAVTLVLAGMLLAITSGTLELWRRTQEEITLVAQARQLLAFLEQDLHSATPGAGAGSTWLAVDVINQSGALANHGWRETARMKPAHLSSLRVLPVATSADRPAIAEGRFGRSGAWLRLLVFSAGADGGGPCAVSYHLVRRPLSGSVVAADNPAEVRYALFRSAIAADTTFEIGLDVLADAYASATPNPSVARSAATLMNPAGSDVLASNVVDFGIWLYVREVDGSLRRIFPETENDTRHRAQSSAAAGDNERSPAVADVMVRILTEEGARVIAALEQGSAGVVRPPEYGTDMEWWWALAERHSLVFVRRVRIGGGER